MSVAPTCTARGAKLVLQENSKACTKGILPVPQPLTTSLCTTLLDCGRVYVGPPGTRELAVSPRFSTAADAVTTLNVEPGGSVVWTARLSSGCDGSFDSWVAYAEAFLKSWSASLLGSYVGSDTIARILPVLGSSATTAPCTSGPSALSWLKAAACAAGLIVSRMLPPLVALPLTRSTSRLTNRVSSSPERKSFCVRSSPVWLPNVYQPVSGAYMKGSG